MRHNGVHQPKVSQFWPLIEWEHGVQRRRMVQLEILLGVNLNPKIKMLESLILCIRQKRQFQIPEAPAAEQRPEAIVLLARPFEHAAVQGRVEPVCVEEELDHGVFLPGELVQHNIYTAPLPPFHRIVPRLHSSVCIVPDDLNDAVAESPVFSNGSENLDIERVGREEDPAHAELEPGLETFASQA
ncbi:hypothetical protein JX266_008475 [Neoarthrinium moseri]|nr:hypothetical protein JX266_008475 [Neoarthrinium moseri]